MCVLPVAMAHSSSGSVVIHYGLPTFVDTGTLCFPTMGTVAV